jgi:hypothetical protein
MGSTLNDESTEPLLYVEILILILPMKTSLGKFISVVISLDAIISS